MIGAAFTILVLANLPQIRGHGRLIEPPSRASAWRYGFNTPHNYNDHELYCGGFTRQWVKNEGRCGVCGDAWDNRLPRPHEFGGVYGQGVIVRNYAIGATMNIRIELTANHHGYFTFSICEDYKNASQNCLDKNILKLVKPQEDVDHEGVRYFPKDGNKVYEMKYRLPKMPCKHCLLQWRYIAGNNWGNCPNGTGAVGCGPQEEFRACADVSVGGKWVETTESPAVTTTAPALPGAEESYNPITSLIISLVTFLAVLLILFLLYFHYYRIGKKIIRWIKGGREEECVAPEPPPRAKRLKNKADGDSMHEISLEHDSLS